MVEGEQGRVLEREHREGGHQGIGQGDFHRARPRADGDRHGSGPRERDRRLSEVRLLFAQADDAGRGEHLIEGIGVGGIVDVQRVGTRRPAGCWRLSRP